MTRRLDPPRAQAAPSVKAHAATGSVPPGADAIRDDREATSTAAHRRGTAIAAGKADDTGTRLAWSRAEA